MSPSIAVGRQLEIDEMIEGYSDDQLGALTYLGILSGEPAFKPRLRALCGELDRRGLLGEDEIRRLSARIEAL